MINRRQFLAWSAATCGGAALWAVQRLLGAPVTHAQNSEPLTTYYFPIIGTNIRSTTLPTPRVVHTRAANATYWTGGGYFYNCVDQGVVNTMVQTGLQNLTGKTTWPEIWSVLFARAHPGGYAPGQKIAIKVNLNNSSSCTSHGNVIDALPHPLIALVGGMVAAGVQPGDVTIYDTIRAVPSYLRNPVVAAYPGVQFVGTAGCTGTQAPGHGKDASLTVNFNDPNQSLQPRYLANVLYDATYVVNMPILKRHSGDSQIPVTLGFKNHFGTIDRISGSGADNLHEYVGVTGAQYRNYYNPLPDIYANPNLKNKTVLTLGDGLFGAFWVNENAAISWNIFGGAANSLFFATDPVAADCVMVDHIVAEGLLTKAHVYDYLLYAEGLQLGLCEGTRANPGGNPLQLPYGSGYHDIQYVRVNL